MKSVLRQTIIATASTLFYEKGYNLTGINEIITKAGIAKATMYSHFKSKEDLLLAYLDAKDEQFLVELKEFCIGKPVGNARLLAVLEFLALFFAQDGFNGCWCLRSVAEVPMDNERVRTKIRGNKQHYRSFLQRLVEENRTDLTGDLQQQLTNRLYLLYEGALAESHLHNAVWPIKTALSFLEDYLSRLD